MCGCERCTSALKSCYLMNNNWDKKYLNVGLSLMIQVVLFNLLSELGPQQETTINIIFLFSFHLCKWVHLKILIVVLWILPLYVYVIWQICRIYTYVKKSTRTIKYTNCKCCLNNRKTCRWFAKISICLKWAYLGKEHDVL